MRLMMTRLRGMRYNSIDKDMYRSYLLLGSDKKPLWRAENSDSASGTGFALVIRVPLWEGSGMGHEVRLP